LGPNRNFRNIVVLDQIAAGIVAALRHWGKVIAVIAIAATENGNSGGGEILEQEAVGNSRIPGGA
jgi:hypothetical protein